MIKLEKRPMPSRTLSMATPLIAVVITMIAGGLLFAALGKNPVEAIRTIFWEPIFGEFAFYYRPQLLVKGAPLVLIAIGLSLGFKAGIWNIGAEGQYIVGAICGAGVGLAFYPTESVMVFPLMILAGALGGCAALAGVRHRDVSQGLARVVTARRARAETRANCVRRRLHRKHDHVVVSDCRPSQSWQR